MKKLAHISDLRFGSEDKVIAKALLRDLEGQGPSLIAVSGDLTQRAAAKQFSAAQSFLQRLSEPRVVIPGNHDVPLYDVFHRFFTPFNRYRKFISDDLNPEYEDDDIVILGLNTARSRTWKSGRISKKQVEALRKKLSRIDKSKFKIVMTHHPFIPPQGDESSGIALVGGAREALKVIGEMGVDLLLAGHLHRGYIGDVRTFSLNSRGSAIMVQAGTAISRDAPNELNAYNLLHLNNKTIQIEVRARVGDQFSTRAKAVYELTGTGWEVKNSESNLNGRPVKTQYF